MNKIVMNSTHPLRNLLALKPNGVLASSAFCLYVQFFQHFAKYTLDNVS